MTRWTTLYTPLRSTLTAPRYWCFNTSIGDCVYWLFSIPFQSISSGFKNYFSKPEAAAATATGDVKPTSSSRNSDNALARTTEQQQQQGGGGGGGSKTEHPALRIRGLENDFSHKPLSNMDEQLEQDLGEMSQSLARLKGLAKGLGTEIDDQNQLIIRIQSSMDKADWRIQRQNKDMERLLKKWWVSFFYYSSLFINEIRKSSSTLFFSCAVRLMSPSNFWPLLLLLLLLCHRHLYWLWINSISVYSCRCYSTAGIICCWPLHNRRSHSTVAVTVLWPNCSRSVGRSVSSF